MRTFTSGHLRAYEYMMISSDRRPDYSEVQAEFKPTSKSEYRSMQRKPKSVRCSVWHNFKAGDNSGCIPR